MTTTSVRCPKRRAFYLNWPTESADSSIYQEAKETVTSLRHMIKPLELELIREKLELLTQSGELSEAAENQNSS